MWKKFFIIFSLGNFIRPPVENEARFLLRYNRLLFVSIASAKPDCAVKIRASGRFSASETTSQKGCFRGRFRVISRVFFRRFQSRTESKKS